MHIGSKAGLIKHLSMPENPDRLHSGETLYRGQSYMDSVKVEPRSIQEQMQEPEASAQSTPMKPYTVEYVYQTQLCCRRPRSVCKSSRGCRKLQKL